MTQARPNWRSFSQTVGMVLYGQIVIGAPGSGKTTYCDGMQQYLRLLGRDCWVVNLDPANEVPLKPPTQSDGAATSGGGDDHEEDDDDEGTNSQLPYETILDVCQDIISLDSVMSELHLGPNGGLLYCMEYIEHHLGEVLKLLRERLGMSNDKNDHSSRAYLLFDLPGQIELTAHSGVVSRIAQRLVRELDLRLVCVQLVDAAVCLTDVSKFIGASLVCTASMMRLELPFVNVLSKMDLLQSSGMSMSAGSTKKDDDSGNDDEYANDTSPLPFNLEFFTQCHDLRRLVDYLDSNPMDFSGISGNDNEEYLDDPEYQRAQQHTRSSTFHRKYHKLHHELCDVVEDFGLLSFLPLSIQDAESVGRVLARIDKCNGYVFVKDHSGSAEQNGTDGVSNNNNIHDVFSSAMIADSEWGTGVLSDVQEKYLGDVMFREEISELKKTQVKETAEDDDMPELE